MQRKVEYLYGVFCGGQPVSRLFRRLAIAEREKLLGSHGTGAADKYIVRMKTAPNGKVVAQKQIAKYIWS